MAYMNYHCSLQPLLAKLRHSANLLTSVQDGRPSQNSLYYLKEITFSSHPITNVIKEELIAEGKKYCDNVHQAITEVCRVIPECRSRKQVFFYSLHHCTLHSVTARLTPLILEHCRDQITQFDNARNKMMMVTLEELHVPKEFHCNVGKTKNPQF